MKTLIDCVLVLLLLVFLPLASAEDGVIPTKSFILKFVEADTAFIQAAKALAEEENQTVKALNQGQLAELKNDDGGLETTVGGTRLVSITKQNVLTMITNNGVHMKLIEKLLKDLDVRPVTFLISAVLLDVASGRDLENASDILERVEQVTLKDGRKISRKDLMSGETALKSAERVEAFAALASALEELQGCSILSRLSLHVRNAEKGAISIGQDGDRELTSTLVVVPTLGKDQSITLDVSWTQQELLDKKDEEGKQVVEVTESKLESSLTLNLPSVAIIGGTAQRDDKGAVNERLWLMQAVENSGDR